MASGQASAQFIEDGSALYEHAVGGELPAHLRSEIAAFEREDQPRSHEATR